MELELERGEDDGREATPPRPALPPRPGFAPPPALAEPTAHPREAAPPEAEAGPAGDPLEHSLIPRGEATPLRVDEDPLVQRAPSFAAVYEPVRVLGRGGMGVVHLARELASGELVAVKRLHRDAGARQFLREARTVASLDHPTIVRLRRVVATPEDELALILDYVEGEDLERWVEREGQLELLQALRLGHALGQALAYAHARGVIHRDVKPGNVLLAQDGTPRLTDFGLALSLDLQSLLETGSWCGTLDYMAPEQRSCADRVDGRADVFGLGATLYHLLTGSSPRVIREGRLPRPARELVLRCVEERAEDRFPDMAAVVSALAALIDKVRQDASGVRAPLERISDDFQRDLERRSRSGRIGRLAVATSGLARLGVLPPDLPERLRARLELGEPWTEELVRLVGLLLEETRGRADGRALLADAHAVLGAALAGLELDPLAQRALRRLARASRTPPRPELGRRLADLLGRLVSRGSLEAGLLPGLSGLPAADLVEQVLGSLRQQALGASSAEWPGALSRWRHALSEMQAALSERPLAERLERARLALEVEALARTRQEAERARESDREAG